MSILSRQDIIKSIQEEGLKIEPFDDKLCEGASYDLNLGKVLKAGTGTVELSKGQEVLLHGGEWAEIMSQEILEFPAHICGSYGIRSSMTRRGLIYFGGPQLDPGWRGRLIVSIYNPTMESIVLRFGEPFFTVTFHILSSETDKPYNGQYHNLTDFPAGDVERMMSMRSKTFSDVFDKVDDLDDSVEVLSTNLKQLTSDVHLIRESMDQFKDTAKKIEKKWDKFFWVIVVTVFATVGTVLAGAIKLIFFP